MRRTVDVRLAAVVGVWPFGGWTAARLVSVLRQTPHDEDPVTGRVTLRPSVVWATPEEREVLQDSPTSTRWPLALAVLWHRVFSRMERAQCPQPWQALDIGEDVERLEGLRQMGAIGSTPGRTGAFHA